MFRHQTTVELQQHQLTEEDDKKNKKKKKKAGRLQSTHESRSPLQELNRITSRRINPAKKNCCAATTISSSSSSICSSSSTSVSLDTPKCCLKFLLSSTSNSRPRSSSSSSSHLQKNPNFKHTNKPLPTKSTPKSAPNSSGPRSNKSITNENDVPKKPSSQSFRKNPSFLSQWQADRRPSSKTASRRSKLSSDLRANLKSPASGGSGRFGVGKQQRLKQKYQQSCGEPSLHFNVADDLIDAGNFTPVGKVACGPSLDYAIVVDDDKKSVAEDSNSGLGTIVVKKTPPIEASVSPEIQCGGSSNPVLGSAATPVCYGAGHLISGVTDKRKCRPRGVLTIGGPTDSSDCGESSFRKNDSNENADVLFTKSRTSLIPLPAEASMKWLLSPPGKEDEVQKDYNNANSDSPFTGSAPLLVSSSPSSCCHLSSDLVSDSGEKNGSGNQDATASTGKTRIVLLSPRRITNFQDFSQTPYEKYGGSLTTPQAKFSCKTDNRQNGGDRSYVFLGERTPSLVDPLSGSNIIQTPTSDSSLDRNAGISWISADDCQANEAHPVVDSMAETFHRISVSPRSQMQMWGPSGLSSQFTDLTSPSCSTDHIQLQLNLDSRASWISDTTVGNLSLSQMRISWREGLVSRILDTDELDCCRCLSDEENYGDRSDELQHKSPKACGMEEFDSLTNGNPRSPEFLEHEPEILRKGKEALSLVGTNICAESISTDAGGLVASEDSDWTLSYKNQLFEV